MVVIALVRRLPRRVALVLGAAVGRTALLLARPERRRALANLARAYPELASGRRHRLARQSFAELGRCAFECMATRSRDVGRLVDTEAAEHRMRQQLAAGRGLVFVSAHFGNWELMAAAVARLSLAPVYVLARRSYDPRFTKLIEDFRARRGVCCLWVESPGHLRRALRVLQSGGIIGVLLDRPVDRGAVQSDFFGHPAPTSPVAAWLSRLARTPVVVGFIRRGIDGRHRLSVRRVDPGDEGGPGSKTAADARFTQRLTGEIQHSIERSPGHWAWSLDRWRSAGLGGS